MIIQVDTLDSSLDTLSSTIDLTEKAIVKAVRPRLYFHNDPAGTFTLSILQGSTVLKSKSLTMAAIITGASWTAGQYHHGMLNFEFDSPLVLYPESYVVQLTSTGYTFSESSYVGWIKSHEDQVNEISGDIVLPTDYPHEFEIWSY